MTTHFPLTTAMRAVLARLELVSNGCIYSYAPVGAKSGFAGSPPTSGDHSPPHLEYRQRWDRAATDPERDAVQHDAELELERLTKRTTPRKATYDTIENRNTGIIKLGEGFPAYDVAIRFRCGEGDVRKVRKANQRDPDTGYLTASERTRTGQAIKLAGNGLSQKQIALKLGVNQSTVSRYLKAAA